MLCPKKLFMFLVEDAVFKFPGEGPAFPFSPFKFINMKAICKFNPLRDVEETVPELAADISEIMATGTVASTATLVPFSKEDDINTVGHYLRDKIQTVMAAKALDASMAAAAARAAAPAATPAATPAAASTPSGE